MATRSSRERSAGWDTRSQQQPLIFAVATIVAALWILALTQRGDAWLISRPIWGLQDSAEMLRFLLVIFFSLVVQCLLYSLLGLFLGTWSRAKGLLNADGTGRSTSRTAISILLFFGGLGTAILLRAQPHTNSLDMLGPFACTLFGYLCGRLCPNLRWSLLVATLGIVLLTSLCVRFANQVFVNQPLMLDAPTLASEDRVRLMQLIRTNNPRSLKDGETGSIDLSQHDINLLLQWGLSLGSKDRVATVNLLEGGALLRASVAVPLADDTRYLNLKANADMDIYDGQLSLSLHDVSLGDWQFPIWLLDYAVPRLVDKVNADPRANQIIRTVKTLDIRPARLNASYGKLRLSGLRDDVFGRVSAGDSLKRSLRAQFSTIKTTADKTQTAYSPFTTQVRESFRMAYRRSRQLSTDPIIEAKAALIALSIQFGHDKIASVIPEMELIAVANLTREQAPQVQERRDLAKHFFASAGLTVLSSQALGFDIGRLKEELDAGLAGGSGFSFADLGADRAGVRLATEMTKDTRSARRYLRALSRIETPDQLIPPVVDFPEGLTLEQLEKQYGGTNGPGYRAMVAKIESRIDSLEIYAPPKDSR